MIVFHLATEDILSETVGKKLLAAHIQRDNENSHNLRKEGFGYLKKNIPTFAKISCRHPLMIITDLDNANCAPSLKQEWLKSVKMNDNLILRIACKEIEAWLLADRISISNFLGITPNKIPFHTDEIPDPKSFIINLAKNAPKSIKNDILPQSGTRTKQGLGYNNQLCYYVQHHWDVERAIEHSNSLKRAYKNLEAFTKV